MKNLFLIATCLVLGVNSAYAQDRHVHMNDDKKIAEENGWIYDNLDKAIVTARNHDMPIMVVIRCPP